MCHTQQNDRSCFWKQNRSLPSIRFVQNESDTGAQEAKDETPKVGSPSEDTPIQFSKIALSKLELRTTSAWQWN